MISLPPTIMAALYAVRQQLQGVTWQRCQTHFTRNVLEASPKALKDEDPWPSTVDSRCS
ncbi:transposase [Paenibacillus larvae]|nr:transposase [Paenibacillus larvae]